MTVVAPGAVPLGPTLGDEVGAFVRKVHEEHGVRFRLGERVAEVTTEGGVTSSGARLEADLVVAGIGN